jgi:hypothetical protein
MSKLSDLRHTPTRDMVGNANISSPRAILAISANTLGVASTSALVYTVNGVVYSRAAFANTALTDATGPLNPTGVSGVGSTYVQPANTTVFYSIGLDAAGAVKVVQGSFLGQNLSPNAINSGAIGGGAVGDGQIPRLPSTVCPVGVLKVVTAGSAFTLGTTALTGIGTFFDVSCLPNGVL